MTNSRFFAASFDKLRTPLRMTEGLEVGADNEFVQVVDITLKMLAVMELKRLGADHRLQRINHIWQINK